MEEQRQTMRYTTHPILLIAAIAVLLFCTIGIAAMMGWLPASGGSQPVMGPPLAADAPVQVGMQDSGPPPPPAGYAPVAPAASLAPVSSGYSSAGDMGGGAPAEARPVAERRVPAATCRSCGVVESVRTVTVRGQGSGVGAAGGAIVGGLLGNQVGSGSGRDLATVAGAVGGAVVGNQVEGNMKATKSYDVTVRMNNGASRTIHTTSANWQEGDRVRIVNGQLRAR